MNDPVCLYATYGPGMGFELALGNDGDFAYSLAGNMGTLFPLQQVGYWEGTDPTRVNALRQQALNFTKSTPSNAPPMPDSAFFAVRYEAEEEVIAGEYALYEPPETIAPLLQEIIDLVHGDWLKNALATLRADCQLLAGQPKLTAEVFLHSIGQQPIQLSNPLLPGVFTVMLLEAGGENTVEPQDHELRITSSEDISSAPVLELAPADQLDLTLEILADIPEGSWDLLISMDLSPQPSATGKQATGVITWNPVRVVIPLP